MTNIPIYIYIMLGIGFLGIIFCLIMIWKTSKDYKESIKDLYSNDYWDILIKHFDEYKPFCYTKNEKFNSMSFSWKDRYDIVVWHEKGEYFTSMHIHNGTDCVISSFNREKSKELANLLVNKYKDSFNYYKV